MTTILEIKNLTKKFVAQTSFWGKPKSFVHAVTDVSLEVKEGEILGLVGESGCGKSTLGRTILRLYKPDAGQIFFEGQDITSLTTDQMRPIRKRMQVVFQDPYASLNPRMTVRSILAEPFLIHKTVKRSEINEKVLELLSLVGLSEQHLMKYPHEFSGGQRQRIGIARALALNPQLIIADEPVSALDVSIQAQIINLLKDLKEQFGLSMIFISHDLKVVEYLAQRIVVMYLGKVMEVINSSDLHKAKHPYTQSLLSAIPVADPTVKKKRTILKGDIPSPINPPSGCVFHTRCPIAKPQCSQSVPELKKMKRDHEVACLLV